MSTSLANISKARRALESAASLDDILKIRDQAKTLETLIKTRHESLEAQNQAAEIKVRAERKAGELISKMEKGKTGPKDNYQTEKQFKSDQLEAIGVSNAQAYRMGTIAKIPDEQVEGLVNAQKATEEQREITSAELQRIGSGKPHVSNNSGENEWYLH